MDEREKRREYNHEYYAKNREKLREYGRKWREENREAYNQRHTEYIRANPERHERYMIHTWVRKLQRLGYTVIEPEGGEA